jgi:hypothetical protein
MVSSASGREGEADVSKCRLDFDSGQALLEARELLHELVDAQHSYAVDGFRTSVSVLLSSESEKAANGNHELSVEK